MHFSLRCGVFSLSLAIVGCGASVAGVNDRDAAREDRVVVDAARADALVVDDVAQREDVPQREDVSQPTDAPVSIGQCETARDCSGPSFGARFGQGWSCIQHRCTYEIHRGQTCWLDAAGCFSCDAGMAPTCPPAPCVAPLAPEAIRMEFAMCARDFFRSVQSCVGRYVTLDDGTVCTVSDAGTGAIRWVLACGPCEVVFTPR